jgi:rod shape-determining protein MreC
MKQRERFVDSSRTLTVLATCLVLALMLLGLSQMPQLQPVRGYLEGIVAPVQQAFSQAAYSANSWTQTLNNMHALADENARLKEQIAQLETQNAQLAGLQTENDTLRKTLGFQVEHPDLRTLPALVIGRDPSGLSRELVLDRGTDDGVRMGMAVTSSGGYLLAVVRSVTAKQATALLIDDIDSSIPARIDRTNVDVVVWGATQHGGRLLVKHIPQTADVQEHDFLKTSGLGGTLPRGLLLGQIYAKRQKDIDLEQEADAYPLADLDSLDQVLVITGSTDPAGAPRPVVPPPGALITPGAESPLYPVPATATMQPTRTPIPTATPLPTVTSTPTPKKKK